MANEVCFLHYRLKNWEGRERRKQKEYEKEKERERCREEEREKEAKRLKEFLEDYDDERDDHKYYKLVIFWSGSSERDSDRHRDRRRSEHVERGGRRRVSGGV